MTESKMQTWQKQVLENKHNKGFDIKSIDEEFTFLQREVKEAFESYQKKEKENFGEELADIAIYLMGIAEYTHYDLEKEIEHKLAKNSHRQYIFDKNGNVIGKKENAC